MKTCKYACTPPPTQLLCRSYFGSFPFDHCHVRLVTDRPIYSIHRYINTKSVILLSLRSDMVVKHGIFGSICWETKEMFLKLVTADQLAETLLPIVQQCIACWSTTVSGKWRGYAGLVAALGYQHQTVNLLFCRPSHGCTHSKHIKSMQICQGAKQKTLQHSQTYIRFKYV